MTVVSRVGIAPHGLVGEDDVHFVVAELRDEIADGAGPQDELNVATTAERLEKLPLKVAGEGCDGSYAQDLTCTRGLVPKGINQFVAGTKDRVRVLKGQLSGFGQLEFSIFADKQGMAEILFQVPELNTQSGLGNIKASGGLRQSAFVSDGPEITQVVIVENGVCWNHLFIRTLAYISSI